MTSGRSAKASGVASGRHGGSMEVVLASLGLGKTKSVYDDKKRKKITEVLGI